MVRLSGVLSENHVYKGKALSPIDHDVVWDADLSAASAAVVGSIMEWAGTTNPELLSKTLRLISYYYELKNAENQSQTATNHVRQFNESAAAIISGKMPRITDAKALKSEFEKGLALVGDPVGDWKRARELLQKIQGLNEIFRNARLVRLFRATDDLGGGLSSLWLANGRYKEASGLVRRVLERERIIAAEQDHRGCILMTMHKSKGKEFDGVVLVEGRFSGSFFNTKWESPPYERSRRLLRVAITRARTLVWMMVWH
ncbi:MAG: 3'-5' exonuclease [Syntrophobacteraceae bacterium]|nr:3'-5' exonuclease [Syntrophobacteraceae bacterium]